MLLDSSYESYERRVDILTYILFRVSIAFIWTTARSQIYATSDERELAQRKYDAIQRTSDKPIPLCFQIGLLLDVQNGSDSVYVFSFPCSLEYENPF